MTPEAFFELFLHELVQNDEMHRYYKFLQGDKSFHFRRNYFLTRLNYVYDHIDSPNLEIWDCGCGYGTTCLFLAMNGIKTYGTTLEFYFDTIEKRKHFWNQYGDSSLFSYAYEDLFSTGSTTGKYDVIIVQDTLHHLEPIEKALSIFYDSLNTGGKILAIEENGQNLIQSLKLYKQRGSKRIITIYDEKLGKEILLGNENIRGIEKWRALFEKNNFKIDDTSIEFIRYYLPFMYNKANPERLKEKEFDIQKKSNFRKKYFFFGINFIANKSDGNNTTV